MLHGGANKQTNKQKGQLELRVQYWLSDGSVVKNLPHNAGDLGSIPGWGRCPGEGNGNPLQYFCLENSADRGAWQATGPGITKSWIHLETKQ